MAARHSNSSLLQQQDPPPLPAHGPAEISELAQHNFAQRRRLYWLKRVLPIYWFNTTVTPLENSRREVVKGSFRKLWTGKWHVETDRLPWRRNNPSPSPGPGQESDITVGIEDPEPDTTRGEHLFQWAVVLEHQRGNLPFLFVLPKKYSSRLLILNDPPAFTMVTPEFSWTYGGPLSGEDSPDFKLDDYPLPDGNWRWASKEWMVDMRDGRVQYDGFEYNWFFSSRGWRSKAGSFGFGAWVRRRRWVRLMERPPLSTVTDDIITTDPLKKQPDSTTIADDMRVWRGDEGDWPRVHDTMRRSGRDGRKLEVWRMWIGSAPHTLGSRFRHKQWSEDETYLPSEVARDKFAEEEALTIERPDPIAVAKVLHSHGGDILQFFVYPGSRLEFLQLVKAAGLAPDLLSAPMRSHVPFAEKAEIHKLTSNNHGEGEEGSHLPSER